MLTRTDPVRDLDRLAQQPLGPAARPVAMPMDAYRDGDTFYVKLDLPGTSLDAIGLTVEQNVLTVHATRPAMSGTAEMLIAERPRRRVHPAGVPQASALRGLACSQVWRPPASGLAAGAFGYMPAREQRQNSSSPMAGRRPCYGSEEPT